MVSLRGVQRLFSMFPTGTAGAALLVLRVSIAATLVVNGTAHWALVTSFWILLGFALLAIFLCLGLLTPYCSAVGCLVQLYVLWIGRGGNQFLLLSSILNSGVLAALGPGAYSIDARVFGRKLLTLPSRR
jgi:uncharacterized membrane protein YphA (DoxX/SURF4 family)